MNPLRAPGAVLTLLCLLAMGLMSTGWSAQYKTRHVFIAVMDGVRYTETFGDPTHEFIPRLWNDLRPHGTLFTNFWNRGITVTRQGHSSLISGTWQMVYNGSARLTRPTLFEYYRDERGAPESKCWSVFGKGEYSFMPYSSHPCYGARLAGRHVWGSKDTAWNEFSAAGDAGVLEKVLDVMRTDQPDIVFINFGYPDHCAHVTKDISEYQAAVKNCDEQLARLWEAIQADPHYRDTTTVFFTNDHGRHTTDFKSHGDHCEGCEHIFLLVVGPDVKRDTVVDSEALQIDVAPTAAELLGIQTPLATGRVLTECLVEPLGLNRKEAVTQTARQAQEAERLAQRDLLTVVATQVLGSASPEVLPVSFETEVLLRGLLRVHADTRNAACRDFARAWVEAHKAIQGPVAPLALGNVILDLPRADRQPYMKLARQIGDLASRADPARATRNANLWAGAYLGRLGKIARADAYTQAGLRMMAAAMAQPADTEPLEQAKALAFMGQAGAAFSQDSGVQKGLVMTAFPALLALKEPGAVWDDPLVSALNLWGLSAAQRSETFQYLRERSGQGVREQPEVFATLTPAELESLAGQAIKGGTGKLRTQVRTLMFVRGKRSLPFSRDALRYEVSEAGLFADGSLLAQGAFLLGYQKLDWRYGGNTWPGPPVPPKKAAAPEAPATNPEE